MIKWNTEKRKVKELKHWDKNPRKITKESFEMLKRRIKERGFHDVIKIDKNNAILSGNQRQKALLELGIEEVNVLVPSRVLTSEEKDKITLESNRSDGIWDFDILANEFDFELLKDVGFSDKELSMSINNMEELVRESELSELIIRISFKSKIDLENCLVEVNEITKKYKNSNITVSGNDI